MNANINNPDDATMRALREINADFDNTCAEIEATFDNTCAEIEAATATLAHLQASLSQTMNELRNNFMTQCLGGPSRAAENAELIARIPQLRVDIIAALRTPTAGMEANQQAINNLIAELKQAVSPDA